MKTRHNMKKTFFILIFIVSTFLGLSMPAYGETNLTLCEDPFPPFVIGEPGFEAKGGYSVKLLERIFSEIEGVSAQFLVLPWKRCVNAVKEGTIDGIIILSYKEDRLSWITYSDPYFISRTMIYYAPEHTPRIQWETLADLSQYWIGVIDGLSYGPDFGHALKAKVLTKIDRSKDGEIRSKKLLKRRVDLMLENELVQKEFNRKNNWEGKILALEKPLKQTPYFMALSNRSAAVSLMPRIKELIAKFEQQGVIKKIFEGSPE